MSSIETAKIRRENNSNASASKRNYNAVKQNNGVDSLKGRVCGMVGVPGPKKVGCVTNLANNRF